MKKQITNVSVHQSSKVIALVYGAFMLLFVPFGLVLLVVGGEQRLLGVFLLLAPVIYGVVAYLSFGLMALVYNLVAARFGGVEFTARATESQSVTPQ